MSEKCEPEKRFDLQISALKENFLLELKALQAEYMKSEQNYPTRQQLNEDMKNFLTRSEADFKFADIYRLLKIIIVFVSGIILTIIGAGISYFVGR
jgi:hypothetical protein